MLRLCKFFVTIIYLVDIYNKINDSWYNLYKAGTLGCLSYPPLRVSVFTIFNDIIKIMSNINYPSAIIGSDPFKLRWTIVRGDTSPLRVEFLEDDEVTPFDISDWSWESSAYDPREDTIDELGVTVGDGFVLINIPSEITALWGIGYTARVAELNFDLQGTKTDGTVWTPVIGTISVLGDVTGGL